LRRADLFFGVMESKEGGGFLRKKSTVWIWHRIDECILQSFFVQVYLFQELVIGHAVIPINDVFMEPFKSFEAEWAVYMSE